jgi:ABC-type sugar transport system substrate-binding protein
MSHSLPKLAVASAALAVALAPTAASAGPSASAAACNVKRGGVPYTISGRHHISCKAAKAAFKAYSPSHPHGYTCSPKQITFSGKCHKGTKRFKYTASQGQQQGKRG